MSHVDEGTLHAYLDGELTPADRAALEAHIAQCAACRERLGEERALRERASALLGRALPPQRLTPHRTIRRLGIPLSWAASVALAVGLGYYLRGSDTAVMPEPEQVALESSRPVAPATAPAAAASQASPPPTTPAPGAGRARRADDRPARAADELARVDANAKFVADSPPGVVAIGPTPELRAPAPAAVTAPAAALAAPRAERDLAALRGRQVTTEWPVIRRGPARDLLGAEPLGVPGLAVREMRSSPTNDGTVLVEQAVDASTVIQLFQRRAVMARAAQEHGTTERLARFVGELRVEIAGPLSQDSLNRLLEQLTPLP